MPGLVTVMVGLPAAVINPAGTAACRPLGFFVVESAVPLRLTIEDFVRFAPVRLSENPALALPTLRLAGLTASTYGVPNCAVPLSETD